MVIYLRDVNELVGLHGKIKRKGRMEFGDHDVIRFHKIVGFYSRLNLDQLEEHVEAMIEPNEKEISVYKDEIRQHKEKIREAEQKIDELERTSQEMGRKLQAFARIIQPYLQESTEQ